MNIRVLITGKWNNITLPAGIKVTDSGYIICIIDDRNFSAIREWLKIYSFLNSGKHSSVVDIYQTIYRAMMFYIEKGKLREDLIGFAKKSVKADIPPELRNMFIDAIRNNSDLEVFRAMTIIGRLTSKEVLDRWDAIYRAYCDTYSWTAISILYLYSNVKFVKRMCELYRGSIPDYAKFCYDAFSLLPEQRKGWIRKLLLESL